MIIKRHFETEMKELASMIHTMGETVLKMLEICLEPLQTFDSNRFQSIHDLENKVNRYHMKIDDLAWKIMALYQPTATDLRTLIGAIKINTNLERAGDELFAMSRRALSLSKQQNFTEPPKFIEIQVMVRSIFKDGLTVISTLDESLAESILLADRVIDESFEEIFESIRQIMHQKPSEIDSMLDFIGMARALEHVGDLSTNLAEIAIFMKKGKDVRHHGLTLTP